MISGSSLEVDENDALWLITQLVVIIYYRCFGKTYRFHPSRRVI